jgi:hypothetical protein
MTEEFLSSFGNGPRFARCSTLVISTPSAPALIVTLGFHQQNEEHRANLSSIPRQALIGGHSNSEKQPHDFSASNHHPYSPLWRRRWLLRLPPRLLAVEAMD